MEFGVTAAAYHHEVGCGHILPEKVLSFLRGAVGVESHEDAASLGVHGDAFDASKAAAQLRCQVLLHSFAECCLGEG